MISIRHLALAVALLLTPALSHASEVTVVEVTYETCAEGIAAVVKGEACYVQGIARRTNKWEITMKFGLFVEATAAAGAGVGGGTSSAFTVKMSIPLSKAPSADKVQEYVRQNPEDVAKKIVVALQQKPPQPPREQDILKLIRAQKNKPFCSMDDDAFKALLEKNSCSLDN